MIRRLFNFLVRLAFLAAVVVRLRSRPDRPEPETATNTRGGRLIDWRRWLVTAAVLGVLAGVGGFVVMISGIVSIKASAGHWSITEALLQFGKRRSVATHSIGTKVPPLEDPSLALRGAGHYEIGCQPCHGSPALRQPRIAQHMLPRPPYLADTVHRYEPAELFQLVKHGIKLTGMPAWPSQRRDDEVWAMVAFLRRFPGMSADEYRRLAHGPAPSDTGSPLEELVGGGDVPQPVTATCQRCHGARGVGRGIGAFPKIAGQRSEYLHATMAAFASGERHSGIMEPIAAGLDAADLRAVADYYAGLSVAAPPAAAARALAEGERLATRGDPSHDIPACVTCHGPSQPRPNPHYPALAGQHAEYLALQLELFKKDNRGGTAYKHVMHKIALRLTPEQIDHVTQYFASLPWERADAAAGPRPER